jgi:hypothetical protein
MLESMKLPIAPAVLFALAATFCFSQETTDPWPKTAVIEPAQLAQILESGKAPMVISVAFPVLYHAKHIVHAIDAGPGSKPEGIEALKKAVANMPKDADIVVYCGCCPMVKCPNIRPAYRTLKELGFTHIRVLDIATNMHTDWYEKNYPSEDGAKDVK